MGERRTVSRAPGRPRSRAAGDAIMAAALELLGERRSVADISVEAIAARAGVGKATIYRRWSGKEDLLTDAVATLRPPLPELGRASARDDLVLLVAQICDATDSPLNRAIDALVMSGPNTEIVRRIKRHVFSPRDEALDQVLRRGVANGEFRPDLDPRAARTLLIGGALLHRRAPVAPSPHEAAETLVTTLARGVRAPSDPR